jgi:hypothetical protein
MPNSEANTNYPTVSHYFTRVATVIQRFRGGQANCREFFNDNKDLEAVFHAES